MPRHGVADHRRLVQLQDACDRLTDRVVVAIFVTRASPIYVASFADDVSALIDKYDPASVSLALLLSAKRLVDHVFSHNSCVSLIDRFDDASEPICPPGSLDLARPLAVKIVADASDGGAETVDLFLSYWAKADLGQLCGAAIGVWATFCGIGGSLGVGPAWCQAAEDGGASHDERGTVAALAPRSIGAACALLALVADGQDALARRLAFGITEDAGAFTGVSACLSALESDITKGSTASLASDEKLCRADDAGTRFDDVEALVNRAASIVARLGGGRDVGSKAAARLDVLLAA